MKFCLVLPVLALPVLALVALLGQSSAWAGPADEQWTAYSITAFSTTGDVTFAPSHISFGNGKFLLLSPAGNVSNFAVLNGKPVSAALFKVRAPDDPVLLSGNRLCGDRQPRPATFIAVWTPEHLGRLPELRSIAVFFGRERPAGERSASFCGTYSYEPSRAHALPVRSATVTPVIPCPATFEGNSDNGADIYDGPPELGFEVRPYEGDVTPDRNARHPVDGWDRYNLNPKAHDAPDLHSYTVVCHYKRRSSGSGRPAGAGADKVMVIESNSGITQCYDWGYEERPAAPLTCTGGVPPIMWTTSDKVLPPPLPEETPPSGRRP